MSMRQLKITNSITNREAESLGKYLQEISKLELITPEDEIKLATLIKKGDKGALDRLTKANLRFVVSVAKKYQGQGLSLPDLINEGNLGLIIAARRFDETRGFKFISFAVWHIRQSILYALASKARMIRLPLNKVALSERIQKTYSLLEQQLERTPSTEELADVLNMDQEEVEQSMGHKNRHISLDTPLSEDSEGCLMDTLENPNTEKTERDLYHSTSLKLEISRSLEMLSDTQKKTICCFFGIGVDHPMCLDDIAQMFSLTTERVRQIKNKAIEKLRGMETCNVLRGFLGT